METTYTATSQGIKFFSRTLTDLGTGINWRVVELNSNYSMAVPIIGDVTYLGPIGPTEDAFFLVTDDERPEPETIYIVLNIEGGKATINKAQPDHKAKINELIERRKPAEFQS